MMLSTENMILFLCILSIIAFLYASVGHGGASGYLALMTLFSFSHVFMKPTALLLNLFVSAIAFYFYYKEGYFNRKLFLYFAIASIPMAYLGGTIALDPKIYKYILGVFLIIAVLKMLNVFNTSKNIEKTQDVVLWQGLLVGAIIGFFSGLIGIGGGIILTPVILLFNWGKIKESAAVSALFIWVNSASGLIGQVNSGAVLTKQSFIFVAIALIGGLAGGYYGSKILKPKRLKQVLAFVLITASIKLFLV